MIARQISASIKKLLPKYPIIAVTGPRQSGKTTLLKNILPDYRYVSLENPDNRAFATDDPNGFLKKYNEQVIFDEVQRVPTLIPYLQTFVDNSGMMGQFVISGSQNFHLLENITQSLAGRVALFKLLPFDSSELKQAALLSSGWDTMITKGFYPAIYDRDIEPAMFYNNYLQTYIDRDIVGLTNVQDLRKFRNFIGLCAARTGQLLNLNNLANQCGITQPTAKSWLSILESSYVVFLLQPYFENFSKRIVKTPKLYFYDVGLAAFLLGLRDSDELASLQQSGNLFENLVIADIIKKNHHQYLLREYWFWRDSNGHEIDLLHKSAKGFDVFEIKSTSTVLPKLFKGMDYFDNISEGRTRKKYLIYGGDETQDRTDYTIYTWNGFYTSSRQD